MEKRGWRRQTHEETINQSELSDIREMIDSVDAELSVLLNERLLLAKRVGEIKSKTGRAVKDEKREREVMEHATAAASDPVISKAITKIYETLLTESCAVQATSLEKSVDANREALDVSSAADANPLYFPRVLILGVGLIGGAMARQIKQRMPETVIIGCDSTNVLETAILSGLIDEASTDLSSAVKNASLILLCAPPEQNLQLLKDLAPLAERRQVIVDVTSAKTAICQLAEELPLKAEFIGGHPLFGSQQQGITNSATVSIDGKTFCLVPTQRTSDLSLRRLIRWLSDLDLKVELVSSDAHDQTVAATSHLVQLVATTLGSMLADESAGISVKTKASLSGPALKGFSRLMQSPPGMWSQIIKQNKTAICGALDEFTNGLQTVRRNIAEDADELLCADFEKAANFAKSLDATNP